jgi:Rad3-related DNA helicase
MDLSSEWYQRQAMISIIQAGGRSVRSKEDWANTYILDASFNFLWSRFKKLTPEWWKEAFTRRT